MAASPAAPMNNYMDLKSIPEDTRRALILYTQKAHELLMNQFSLRTNMEQIDRYYMRETDWTAENVRARIANRVGDKKKFQDVQVPIVMPQVEAALGYLMNVFLTGYPIFGVSSDPATMPQALQMETIIGENAITAGWARQLIMFFRDGLKYNLHGIELDWAQKTVYELKDDASQPSGAKAVSTLWKGNTLRRLDLYNTFFDPRVHPAEIHEKAEYVGYIEMYSRVRMKQLCNDLFSKVPPETIEAALKSGPAPGGMTASGSPFSYYVPMINPFPIMDRLNVQTFDWMAWATAADSKQLHGGLRYGNVFEVATIYARLIPADFNFKVPAENTPQIFKWRVVNGSVILSIERLSNAHNFIPCFFGQPLEDGLDFQTKSFAANVMDMQDIAGSMWNGYMAGQRRLIGDRVLYDPLRVRAADINNDAPAAKIPVRPSAFGKPLAESVYAFPFRNEQTQTFLDGSKRVIDFANVINNQNPAQQGQFVKGNKTKFEYDDVMGHGNAGNQKLALSAEYQVLIPLKECIKLNILQNQEPGQLYNRDAKQTVTINPSELRKAGVHFKISDGLLPEEKEMDTDEFQTALQTLGSSPSLQAAYEMGPLFTYIMQLRGADLTAFQKSPAKMQYEQQQQIWQTAIAELLKMKELPTSEMIQSITKLLQTQPQPSQQMQQEMQQGGAPPDPNSPALESTQGGQ